MNIESNHDKGEVIIFTNADGAIKIDVRLEDETVWLSQKKMAELFDKDSDTVGLHLKNIYAEAELDEHTTTEFFPEVRIYKRGIA